MDLKSLSNKIERIEKHLTDGVLVLASIELQEAYAQYSRNISLLFLEQKIAFREGDIEKAVDIFRQIQENYYHEERYKSYLLSLAQAVFYQCQNEYYAFFINAPRKLQKELLINAAAIYEKKEQRFEACKLYSIIAIRFPEMISVYGPLAAQLALQCEEMNQPLPHLNTYRSILVQSILPQILTQSITIRSSTKSFNSNLSLTMEEITAWLEAVQSYYFSRHHWRRMHELIVLMIQQCGFLSDIKCLTDTPPNVDNTLLFPEKVINHIVSNPSTIPVEFEFRFFAGCFVQLAFEYYSIVSGYRASSSTKITIIPVGLIRKDGLFNERPPKKRKYTSNSKSNSSQQSAQAHIPVELLMILRKAGELKRHINTLSLSYDVEFPNLCTRWRLPFDIQNAVDTMMADLNVMEGNPSIAIPIYKSLSARLKKAWAMQKEVRKRICSKLPCPNPTPLDATLINSRWSKLFPFRILYTLAVASVLDGHYRAAINQFLSIICTLTCEEIESEAFYVDKEFKFRFKEATAEALIARCIHDILYAIEKEIQCNGFDDTLIVCRLVLSQFTFSYASLYIQQTFETVAKNGTFTFPQFFEFIFDENILQIIHQTNVHNYHPIFMLPNKFYEESVASSQQVTQSPSQSSQMIREQVFTIIESTFAKARLRQTQKKLPLLLRFCQQAFRKLTEDK
ncbi:hypothetical protein K7432_002976 [Basidiobolus ranarum]|uniref:Integrator complex subunit 10 n=1 Tax=Basidiobolus ranarum TaxID=34480 RepID=A0ABR2X0K8_9FUNG